MERLIKTTLTIWICNVISDSYKEKTTSCSEMAFQKYMNQSLISFSCSVGGKSS